MRALLVIIGLFAASPAWAGADEMPPDPPIRTAGLATLAAYCDRHGGCQPDETMGGVPRRVTGTGTIRIAQVIAVGDGEAARWHVVVRAAEGWGGVDLGYGPGDGTTYTLEVLRLVDLVGDEDPELLLEIGTYREPCGPCEDGPSFASTTTRICTAATCTPWIVRAEDVDDGTRQWSFEADLRVERSGDVHLELRRATALSPARARALRRVRACVGACPRP